MLAKRIIPCLDVTGGRVVKGVNFLELRDALGISAEQLMSLGRVNSGDQNESFCMTVIGLKMSRSANAVSQLHGHISRRMWKNLWPQLPEAEIPITSITNGIHTPTWVSPFITLATEASPPSATLMQPA